MPTPVAAPRTPPSEAPTDGHARAPLDDDHRRRQEAAEQVRRHLVALRGGAPFLSPDDAAQLVAWLEEGMPVARILLALEDAAHRRVAERARAPLTLRHARRELTRARRRSGRGPSAPPPEATPTRPRAAPTAAVGPLHGDADHPLAPLIARATLAGMVRHADALRALPADAPDLAADAISALSSAWEGAWETMDETGRGLWRDEAVSRLGELAGLLDEGRLDALVEEHARALFRLSVPGLSASDVLGVLS